MSFLPAILKFCTPQTTYLKIVTVQKQNIITYMLPWPTGQHGQTVLFKFTATSCSTFKKFLVISPVDLL